jgi:energy-coupling factor transporter ATP-binding protein EcfA2
VSLQDDIFAWVRRQPPWKQELYLRTALSPELEASDIEEVTAMLLGETTHTSLPREVVREDLPGAFGGGQPMYLESLSEISNVNVLADGETLAFQHEGLNVVYGKNGSGKTGYARIVKHCGRTLRRETVLANVGERVGGRPFATVTVKVGREKLSLPVDLEAPPPAHLARICVADSLAGERYLTADTEVDYAPAALQSLSRLADGLKAVGRELSTRVERAQPTPLDLRPFGPNTEVTRLLQSLSTTTNAEAIEAHASWSEEERAELEKLRRKHGEILAMQAPRLRKVAESSAEAADGLAAALREISSLLGPQAVQECRARHEELSSARAAERTVAARFAAEPLDGVGSDAWKHMWEAARAYVEHLGQTLPPTHDGAACPLCMQPLGDEARARLGRFEDFVKADISRQVHDIEQKIEAAREAVPVVERTQLVHAEALKFLDDDPLQSGEKVRRWLDLAQRVAKRLRAGDLDGLEPVEVAPLEEVEAWAAARTQEAAEHAALQDTQEQERVTTALAEFEACEELGHRLPEVLAHLRALREVEAITAAKRKIGTSHLSNTMTALSRQLIEADLQGALNRHLHALNFNGLTVIVKPKTVRGKSMVALRFKSIDNVPLNSVLSQGEQRRLALAMFLAEMEVLGEPNPVVLDDPVSSIDQEGRRHVAKTLCRLAQRQQVIIFTHELSFVHELQRQAPSDLAVNLQHLARYGRSVGHVREGLPWEGKKARQRRQELQDMLTEVRAVGDIGDEASYQRAAREFCVKLRESFERAVEEVILGETVTRRDDTIHTKNLRKVIWSEEICVLVDRGVDECSPWAHDRPLADGADPPTVDELREGLELFGDLLDLVREARSDMAKSPELLGVVDLAQSVRASRGEGLSVVGGESSEREPFDDLM